MSRTHRCCVRALLLGASGLAGLLVTADLAQAQSSPPPAQQPDAETSDIIVTAQRREERLVDIPQSIVAVNEEAIRTSGVVSVHDINKLAAGVQINFAGCCTQPAIRGVSTLTTGIGFENNVAIYIDGFYAPDNLSINGDIANLASIQVLKGPQGTLWGRNATGGAILFNTKRPSDTWTTDFEVGFARYGEITAQAYVSGPISDSARFSVSGYRRKSDGYYRLLDQTGEDIGPAAPIEQVSARAKLELDLGEDTLATFGANYGVQSDPRGLIFTVLEYPATFLPAPPARASEPFTATFDYPLETRATLKELTLKLEHETGFGSITSYTGYAWRTQTLSYDFDGTYLPFVHSRADWDQDTFQQTIDVNVTSIAGVNLVLGASYYEDRQASDNQESSGLLVLRSRTDTVLKARAIAGYVDASINLTDRLVLDVGARYTREKKAIDFARYDWDTGAVLVGPFDLSKTFKAFTPRGSLRYELAPRTNIYASISTGFRSGGYNPNGAANLETFLPFDPEKITAYEIGFKTSRGAIQFDAAAFYYDFRDLQVGLTREIPPYGLINSVFNAPKAEIYGVDAQVSAMLFDKFNIRAGGAWVHGRYKDFSDVTGIGLNAETQTNVTNQLQDWSGKQMARSPSFSGNVGVDYRIDGVAGGALALAANMQYTTSFVTNNASLFGPLAGPELADKQRYRQPAYATVNAQISWTDASDHLTLTAYVNNLTDHRYRMSYNGNFTGDYATYAQPITWGAKIGYRY